MLPVTVSKTRDRLAGRRCYLCSFFFHENKQVLLYKITIFRVPHLFTIMLAHSILLKLCKIDIFGIFSFKYIFFCFHSPCTSFTCSLPSGPIYTSKTYFQRTISLSIACPRAVKVLFTYTSLRRGNFFA